MLQRRKIVISVHGINTHGEWELDLAPLISEQGWIYYPLHYGNFSILSFFNPWKRNKQIEWFREKYNQIKANYPKITPSVVAHSFGTFIVCKALEKYEGIKFDKIILIGSILPRKFDWNRIFLSKRVTMVRNDYAYRDWVVWLAPLVAWWETGRSGLHGFQQKHKRLSDNSYGLYSHSSAFGADHYKNFWIPFLNQSMPYEGEKESPQEEEEPVSAMDAAKWSAVTYFHQFISPLIEGISKKEFRIEGSDGEKENSLKLEKFYVVIPETPSRSSRTAINDYCRSIGAKNFKVKNLDREREIKIANNERLFDIPTILNSLIYLDHRTEDEFPEAISCFCKMLNELLGSPKYSHFTDRIRVIYSSEFKKLLSGNGTE